MDRTLGDSRPLLKAKLLVPHVAATSVNRPRLQDKLQGTAYTRLTTVVAPAGWGKTTLLASWARTAPWEGRVGWLSLDEADDEPVRFWTYALSALGRVAPEVTRDSLAALSAPGFDPVAVALAELLNAATAVDGGYALVLDDFHALGDPLIHQNVEFLLSYLPPSLRLVVASRFDPPLPLARMRARGELAEIRVGDLRCTPSEGEELLSGVGGASRLSTEASTKLVQRAEGWPAALHLTAISLRESQDPGALADRLRGEGRHILDYFAAEVIPTLGDRERDLLVRCSTLERLSAPLCDMVLGTADAADALEHLDRAGLFVTALGGGWYRCHQLFREVLRRELRATDGAASEMLGRAADWFLSQGQVEEAIEHRLAAGHHAAALDLLLTSERWFMDRGAAAAFLRLGELLASSVSDPRLCVALAVAAGESGQEDRCAHWLHIAEPLITADTEPLPGWRTLRAEADTVWATFTAAGDAEGAVHHSTRAVDLEVDPSVWGYVLARQAHGGALLGAGRTDEGLAVLWDCWRSPARRQLPALLLLQAAGQLSLMLVEAGDLEGSVRVAQEVRALAAAAEEAWGPGAAPALAGLRLAEARVVMTTDPTNAVPALEEAVSLAEGWGWATVVLASLTSLAAARWTAGDHSAAREALARASDVADSGDARPATVEQFRALEARIGRGAGKKARAQGILLEELTDRELSVLRALRGPLTAREIGSELLLSINTVKGYTKSLYRKLGVVSRADAVRRGHELGLI